ncbi:uncharacterized protein [Amphiura filiformis]|uniref:uncharacterized protein n=1 Tax=Amphiura filiformis TaxID=82378 RepID=UPI003B21C185
MKAIILAGGYGTRLQRDLQSDHNGPYKHLLGMPKALLPIGHLPLISHWMKVLESVDFVDQTFVLCNDFYLKQFEHWLKDWPGVTLISDGTTSNENRIGAVGGINLVVEEGNIQDDIMVIGGDTLFYGDFKLANILTEFKEHKSKEAEASLVLGCQCTEEETSRFGILEIDPVSCRVTAFLEKPGPEITKSRTSCPCFYIFSKHSLPLIRNFLQENKDGPLKNRDATGHFVHYLFSRQPVFVHNVSSRFDVGALSSYIECHKYFLEQDQSTS